MRRLLLLLGCAGVSLIAAGALSFLGGRSAAAISSEPTLSTTQSDTVALQRPVIPESGFEVDILVNGRPLEEYYARGRAYVEAREGAEYEVRIRNPLPFRVAVALSVDGLNSIDARRTAAWNASKWVIGPYETIQVGGWQMSSERARRFYFTTERDSYAAKLGQTSNLGIIAAVFFRERRPIPVEISPPPRPLPRSEDDRGRDRRSDNNSKAPGASAGALGSGHERKESSASVDDEYAATGIGRSVRNDVRWVEMNLDSRSAAEVTIRYEYYQTLVRLGILPRGYYRPDSLRKREGATGFEDRRFSPEP